MKHEIDGEMCIDGTFHHCENCHRSFVTAIELLPNLSAAVQALEGLVTRWQGEAASCRARFFDDLQAPSMLPTRAVAYSMCADELADALATLRQREDTTR